MGKAGSSWQGSALLPHRVGPHGGKGLFGVAAGLKGSAVEVAGQGSQSLLTNPSPWRRKGGDVAAVPVCTGALGL